MFYVYILECADQTYYVGCTNDLIKRVHQHNHAKSGAHYTKIRRPVTLKYSEQYSTLGEGRKREAEIKRMKRANKYLLVKGHSQIQMENGSLI
jgi:putative endonuclease